MSTSPSPKLDSTPATWTSASGQICWMIPVMNVPWPASKSSVRLWSSSYSSSSSTAPTVELRIHGACSRAHVSCGCSTASPLASRVRSPVSRTRICGARCGSPSPSGWRSHAGAGAGSDVVFSTGPTSVSMTSAVNIIPPTKCASAPTGEPSTLWLPSTTWLGSATAPGIAKAGQHLLDRASAPPTLTLDDGELDAGDVDAGQAAAAPALLAEGLRLVREHLLDGAHRTLEGLLVLTDVDDDAVRSQQHECSLTVDRQHDPTAPEHRRPAARAVRGGRRPDSRCSQQLPPPAVARSTTGMISATWR